jgi:hypothetical protein
MKKLLYTFLVVTIILSACKKENASPTNTNNNSGLTYIPNDDFEAYLEANGIGNGIGNDDYVFTAAIDTVSLVNLFPYDSLGNSTLIAGNQDYTLTGIEDFSSLQALLCHYCLLTDIDVSQNINLFYLICIGNNLSSLDLSNNTNLETLLCGTNQLTSLDVSNNTALRNFQCNNNQLTSLDVRNGNNTNMIELAFHNNPNLTCINVDNAAWSSANWGVDGFSIDTQQYFSNNCP